MSEKKVIITIGRQYGSGGAAIGQRLAEELGIGFYDKNILRMNSDESGIKESYFHLADEKAGSKLLYRIISSLTPDTGAPTFGSDIVSSDNLFRFQSEVIRKLADEESCVIIGRCADYVLAGRDNLVRVHIYAPMEAREARIREKKLYDEKDLEKNIRRVDRERRDYYRYYTGKDWEAAENYDLLINSGPIGVEGCVQVIKDYLRAAGYDLERDFPKAK